MAADFKKAYHGHLFLDRNGNEGRAYVEFAPFQKIPREQRKPDAKQGTIEEGEAFGRLHYRMNMYTSYVDRKKLHPED